MFSVKVEEEPAPEGEDAAPKKKLVVEILKKASVPCGVYDFVHALTESGLEH